MYSVQAYDKRIQLVQLFMRLKNLSIVFNNKGIKGSILKALEKAAKSDRKSTNRSDKEDKENPAKIDTDDIYGANGETVEKPARNEQPVNSKNTNTPKPPKQQSYFKRIMQEMKVKCF